METRRCVACGCSFPLRSQNPHQTYCKKDACQRERRRRWQQMKRLTDADYRENQATAHKAWLQRRPEYWQEYRATHPESVEKNRLQQRARRHKEPDRSVAKMDASIAVSSFASGTYRLIRLPAGAVAKMDAWTVEISVISTE